MTSPSLDPNSRRALVVLPLVLALLTMLGPLNIDTPMPAFTEMGEEFAVSSTAMQWMVTAYMASFAVMSIFHGPLSDALGRKPVILGGLAVYVVASVGAALAPTYAWVIVFRVMQGLTAGGATIVSRTVIRDVFHGVQAQRLMSFMAMVFGLAPVIAPIVGGGLLQLGSWHLIFWFMAVFSLVLIVATLLALPETLPVERRTPVRPSAILAGLAAVFRHAGFHRVAWSGALLMGGMFLYIGGSSIFLTDLLGYGEMDFWRLFAPMIVFMTIGSTISARAAGRVSARTVVNLGFGFATVGGVIGVLLALTDTGKELPLALVTCCAIALGSGAATPSLQLMVMDLFPDRLGAASSGQQFVQLMFSAVTSVACAPLLAHSTAVFSGIALICVLLGLVCWLFHLRSLSGEDGPLAELGVEPTMTGATA